MTCTQSRTYQISCIRISLEPLAILLHVPACNLWKDYFCFYFWVKFPSWLWGLSSSARACPVWKKPVVCGENDSDGKLQKVQRCRQRCKLIWTSLMWKSEWSLLKKLSCLVRHLADQSFCWVWSDLRVTFSAQFPYFSFRSTVNEKWTKSMMVSVCEGKVPAPVLSALLSSTHWAVQPGNNKNPNQLKCPFWDIQEHLGWFWSSVEVVCKRWIIILPEQAYFYGGQPDQLAAL